MATSLTNVLLHIGSDNVNFQTLDQSFADFKQGKKDNRVTFYTDEVIDPARILSNEPPLHKMGLVVWLDRSAVTRAMNQTQRQHLKHEIELRDLMQALRNVLGTEGALAEIKSEGGMVQDLLDSLEATFQ